MRTKIIIAGFIALSTITNAQNTVPNGTGSGNVGIGTSSPAYPLDVQTTAVAGMGIRLKHNGPNGEATFRLNAVSAGGREFGIHSIGNGWGSAGAPGTMMFRDETSSIPCMIFQGGTGWAGMGTLSPQGRLHVNRDLVPPGSYALHRGIKSNIQGTAPIIGGGPTYAIVGVEGNSTGYNSQGETYGVIGNGTYGFLNVGGQFQGTGVYGCSVGDAVYGVRAIATGGQHNYGIYAESNGFNPSCTNNYAGYFVGNVLRTGWDNFTSDRKLKKEILPLENALDNIMKLKPSIYQYRTDEFKTLNLPQGSQMGLIAQELEQVFPDLVTNVAANFRIDENGNKVEYAPEFKAVRYINLIPVLIAGIQEQQKQIAQQKELIEELRGKPSNATGVLNSNDINGFQMSQNEPNPFTNETIVNYTLPSTVSKAFMAVYDLSGKQIKTIQITEIGTSSLKITSADLSAGIYIYSIVADGKVVDTKKMIVADK